MNEFIIAKIEQEINRAKTLVQYANLSFDQTTQVFFGLIYAKNALKNDAHKGFKEEKPSSEKPKLRLVRP